MPNCPPLTVSVSWGTFRGATANALSKVNAKSRDDVSFRLEPAQFQTSRIKGVSLAETIRNGYCYSFTENMYFCDYYSEEDPDLTITYNKRLKDEFSYSLFNSSEDKYDFVTVVLRDLLRGLGFNFGIKKTTNGDAFAALSRYETAFETRVLEALGNGTLEEMYQNATQGEISVDSIQLYAPTEWKDNISLNYFIPNHNYSITKVLAYDFGRGTISRNLNQGDLYFERLLDWIPRGLLVGSSGSEVSAAGSSEIKVPFNGVYETTEAVPAQVLECVEYSTAKKSKSFYPDTTVDFLSQFHVFKGTGSWKEGISICLLKKDGTWDLVYFTPIIPEPYVFKLNMPEWTLNCTSDEYARSVDGYLRGRITLSRPITTRKGYNYTTTYFVVDYTPQKMELMEATEAEAETPLLAKTVAAETTRKVRVQFKNIEGTTRVVIERKRQGHRVPSKFDVPDFKKGYFETDVETAKETTFTAIAYNENGSTKSLPLLIEPLTTSSASELSFNFNRNTITVCTKYSENNEIAYEISPLTASGYNCTTNGYSADGCIDVSMLPQGLYVIKCTDKTGNTCSYKFKLNK